MTVLPSFGSRLTRRKHIPKGDLTTNLKRCLNTFDVTMIGLGHMVGPGIFVTTGEVMRNLAGPSTTFSYIFSGLGALLSALCYAEFGARYPKTGSAYTYAYVGCGEIWAFIIGWNVVLEYVLATAAYARTFTGYFDALFNFAVRDWTLQHFRPWPFNTVPLNHHESNTTYEICVDEAANLSNDRSLIGTYPDFIALVMIILNAIVVAIGSRTTSNFNTFFQLGNFVVIGFVVCYGVTFADFSNWKNFFPCGINGVLAGASKCFFAYVGFDGLATAGEEAKNPSKMIPRATYYSMAVAIGSYVAMSATLSLMMPYYKLPSASVYSEVFIKLGAPEWIALVISIGALIGILTSITNGLYSLPRALYAMADDGLIFACLAKVNKTTKTPINATLVATILVTAIGITFDVEALIDFLSIGTLLAYSMVSAALIILRYRPQPLKGDLAVMDDGGTIRPGIPFLSEWLSDMKSGKTILSSIIVMTLAFTGIGVLISTSFFKTSPGLALMIIFILIAIGSCLFIDAHRQNSMELDYKARTVFLVPYIPALSLLFNVLMMTQLTFLTWIRLAVWMTIGMAIYFFYGISHSKEELIWKEKNGAITVKEVNNYYKTDISIETPAEVRKNSSSNHRL